MSYYNSIYDSESVTTLIHDLNYIHFMQKILHVCLHIYTHYLSKQKGHYVSKSIDCKLYNDLQYVDIVFITLCFYQVDRVHNTQFILCLHFYFACVSVYVFNTFYVTHLAVL